MYSKTNISNTVSYNGTVDLKLQRNGNTYKLQAHNTGTKVLTDTIVRALCGNNISDYRPAYLAMGVIKDEGRDSETFIDLLRYDIPFTGITWGDVAVTVENGTGMILTATILPDDKLPMSSVNLYPIEIQMRSANNEKLAVIRSKGKDDDTALHDLYNSLGEGTSGIIEWCMKFKYR